MLALYCCEHFVVRFGVAWLETGVTEPVCRILLSLRAMKHERSVTCTIIANCNYIPNLGLLIRKLQQPRIVIRNTVQLYEA